jgi:hypothetical protein
MGNECCERSHPSLSSLRKLLGQNKAISPSNFAVTHPLLITHYYFLSSTEEADRLVQKRSRYPSPITLSLIPVYSSLITFLFYKRLSTVC